MDFLPCEVLMKKAELINSEISYVVSRMGHFDGLTICDAGLPVPDGVQRIDLAVSEGVPSFMQTVKAVVSELEIQDVELAEEFKEVSPELHQELVGFLADLAVERGRDISLRYMPHEEFKQHTATSKAVVRTGEYTPFANVILKSGVVF